MTELMSIKETMSSLQIAEITGKQHQHVMRDIRILLEQGVGASNFGLSSYKTEQNKELPCYILTKKGCLILASGYNALLREKIINRWEELETQYRNGGFSVPQSLSEALMLAAKQAEQLEVAQKQIEQKDRTIQANAPRVRFSNRKIFSRMFACCKNMPNFALEHHNILSSWAKKAIIFFTKIKETRYGGGMETALSHTRPAYVVMFTPTVGFSLLLNSIRFEHE